MFHNIQKKSIHQNNIDKNITVVVHQYNVVQHVSQLAGTYINQPQGGSNSCDISIHFKIFTIPLNIFTEKSFTGQFDSNKMDVKLKRRDKINK